MKRPSEETVSGPGQSSEMSRSSPVRRQRRLRMIIWSAVSVLAVSAPLYAGCSVWGPGDGDPAEETSSPGPGESSSPAASDDLYETVLSPELCQQIADEFQWHSKSGVTQRNEGSPEVRSRAYCQIYPEDVAGIAAAGASFLSFSIDVRVDAAELMTEEGAAERAPVLPSAPTDVDDKTWLEFLDSAGTFEEFHECDDDVDGCDGGVLTVPCQTHDFSATYDNLQVYFNLHACNQGEFDEGQAAATYSEVFTFLAESLTRE